MKEKQVKLTAENPHVNPLGVPVTSDSDSKLPANQRIPAIRLLEWSILTGIAIGEPLGLIKFAYEMMMNTVV